MLEEVIELKAMETLTSCENKARAVAGNANFKFNRKEAKTIYEKDTQVIAGGLGPQFRQSIKSLMDAYVNTEAFLEVTCDPNKTKIH